MQKEKIVKGGSVERRRNLSKKWWTFICIVGLVEIKDMQYIVSTLEGFAWKRKNSEWWCAGWDSTRKLEHYTLNDVYKKCGKNDKVGLKQTTRNNYIYMYEHFCYEWFGNRKIKEIENQMWERYYNNGIVDSKKMSVATLEEYSYDCFIKYLY